MTTITFYEKPGCANNTRQKALLAAAGHEVIARNLLTELWTRERLLAFFGERPATEWFNRAAPRVKSGEVIPSSVWLYTNAIVGPPVVLGIRLAPVV